jgi:HNH endonuclease
MEKKHITKEMLSEKGMLDVSKYSQQDNAFYSSNKWRCKSKKYKELYTFCEVCLKEGIEKPSEIAHHITPISQGGAPYDENNLLAICKKCHREIHTGIGIRIDLDFLKNLDQKESTPEDEWWDSGPHDLYLDKQKEIIDLINDAEALEKNDIGKSIKLYFSACKLIDNFKKILADDFLLEKAYCQQFGVSSFRTVRYPINRLSLLLEKSKRYAECIELIKDYENKNDKLGLTSSDYKIIQKRKYRVIKKVK